MSVPGRDYNGKTSSTKSLLSVSRLKDVHTLGSDIEYDFVCDPCKEEGHRFEAHGFCSDCNHYLCETCYTAHCRPIPMRNHKLLDENEMPKIRLQPTSVDDEIIEEKCDVHVGKVVEYYCGYHDKIGCTVCMNLDHTSCDKVQFVPSMDMEVINDRVHAVIERLSTLRSKIKHTLVRVKQHAAITGMKYCNTLQEAKQFSEHAKNFIEKLEKEFVENTQLERDNQVEKLESAIDALEKTTKHTESLSEELSGYISHNKEANLFIAMKKAEKFLEYSSHVDRLDISEDRNMGYVFMPNKELLSLQEKVESLGIVKPELKQVIAEPSSCKEVKVRGLDQFTVHAKNDTSSCIIVGISEIREPSGVVIADAGNDNIRVSKDNAKTVTRL